MEIFSFSNCHFNFKAHFLVFLRSSIILSLILIPVSFGWLLGLVDLGIRPSSPRLLYEAAHLSRLLWLCGHTLATSFSFNSLLMMGNTHLNLSSLIVFGILIHILQDIPILEKPPYVCGYYHAPLTNLLFGCIMISYD